MSSRHAITMQGGVLGQPRCAGSLQASCTVVYSLGSNVLLDSMMQHHGFQTACIGLPLHHSSGGLIEALPASNSRPSMQSHLCASSATGSCLS